MNRQVTAALIELIPDACKVKFSRDYSARSPLAVLLGQKLSACKTADDCRGVFLELCKVVPGASGGTRNRWRRAVEARIVAIQEEAAAARAAIPLIWTPPAPAPRKDEPLIVLG